MGNTGIEIGLYTLGDIVQDPVTGKTISAQQRMKEVMEAAKLADDAGLDIFGVGEHHRLDYAIYFAICRLGSNCPNDKANQIDKRYVRVKYD